MDENNPTIELKDFMECLRDENNRLLNQLCFAQKCMKLFEDYRQCLIGFANNCVCDRNFDNQLTFNQLEQEYRSIIEEDMRLSAIFTENTIKVSFNKQTDSETNDTNSENQTKEFVATDCTDQTEEVVVSETDQTEPDSGNVLSKKLSLNLKNLKDNEDYRLMYLKNKSVDNCEHFKCNWFKCSQIFGSESTLSQHIRSEHFRVYQCSDDLFSDEPQEMIIKVEPELIVRPLPVIQSKPKRKVEEFVCEWIGCNLGFRSEVELRRHENLRHKQNTVQKSSRFMGLKPLTIHTIGTTLDRDYTEREGLGVGSAQKIHFCEHCDYRSNNKSHVKRHILRKHTNERPYKCDLDDCHPGETSFATIEQLRGHQTRKHPNQVF